MHKLLIILVCILCTTFAFSQESVDTTDVQFSEIQEAYKAILQLREASESGDSAAIEQAYQELENMQDVNFKDERWKSEFSSGWQDSDGRYSAHQQDSSYTQQPDRGSNYIEFPKYRSINTDVNCTILRIKANSTTSHTYTCRGNQELAVVAGAGGKVTIKVHVINSKAGIDFRSDDTDDVRRGRPYRKRAFKLPGATTSTIRVKIINCSDKACDVVLIKNN